MLSALPGLAVLGLAALAALVLAIVRKSSPDNVMQRRAASRALSIALAVQVLHFGEELLTGFYEKFPALFGLPAMSITYFVSFNLIWIAIWVASIPGVTLGQRAALFAAWFLAIAAMINGVAHPALAIKAGGYFPGLVTSPFIAVAGILLWLRLRAATEQPVSPAPLPG
jgi:hypothetical protein